MNDIRFGIVAIDKMQGATSAKIVAATRKLYGKIKAGHAGTLDPMATGVLPVLLGEATAFARFLPPEKTYEAEICFGAATDTDDAEGQIIARRPPPADLATAIQKELPSFVGDIAQTAPTYSALKHQGKPMYYYARGNIAVAQKQRQVQVYEVCLESVTDNFARLTVHCGSGFYVRALARDLGERLQCGAHLSALRRLYCSSLDIADAVLIDSLAALNGDERNNRISPIEKSLTHLPLCELDKSEAQDLGHGRIGNFDTIADMPEKDAEANKTSGEATNGATGEEVGDEELGELVRFVADGRFAGVGRRNGKQTRAEKMLSWTREI